MAHLLSHNYKNYRSHQLGNSPTMEIHPSLQFVPFYNNNKNIIFHHVSCILHNVLEKTKVSIDTKIVSLLDSTVILNVAYFVLQNYRCVNLTLIVRFLF